MKRIITGIATIILVLAFATTSSLSLLSDSESSENNTFATGVIDLTVGGGNSPLGVLFSGDTLMPGKTVNAGTVEVKNAGDVAGKFTLMMTNVVSNENGLYEPEIAAGDLDGVEVDPTGYDANDGDGELWDMLKLTIYTDLNNNGRMEWNEPVIWRGDHTDMTTTYNIPLDVDLGTADVAHGFDGTLDAGESVHIGLLVSFKSDAKLASQPQYNGLSNNMAMSDDASFDLVFGLEQISE